MFKNLIANYIDNMTINDVVMFSQKENIILEDEEYQKIYNYLKDNYELLITDSKKVFTYLEENFSKITAAKLKNLFLKYQKKYGAYL